MKIKKFINFQINEHDSYIGFDTQHEIRNRFNRIETEKITSPRLIRIIQEQLNKVNEFFMVHPTEEFQDPLVQYNNKYYSHQFPSFGWGFQIKYEDYYVYIYLNVKDYYLLCKFEKDDLHMMGESIIIDIKGNILLFKNLYDKLVPKYIQFVFETLNDVSARMEILSLPKPELINALIECFNKNDISIFNDNNYGYIPIVNIINKFFQYLEKNGIDIYNINIIEKFNNMFFERINDYLIEDKWTEGIIQNISSTIQYYIINYGKIIKNTLEYADALLKLKNRCLKFRIKNPAKTKPGTPIGFRVSSIIGTLGEEITRLEQQ